jgi:hypothetical protein
VSRLSLLVALVGAGLLLVATADTIARSGTRHVEFLFLLGLLVLWLPGAALVLDKRTSRTDRILALAFVGTGMFLVRVLYSPLRFSGFDELLHWSTAARIVETEQLFGENPVLPVSPLYPGLEIATSAVSELSGLSIIVSGMAVVGIARFVLVLALYFLYESAGLSAQLAGVATLVYFANPAFLFFDSSYAYESLAISLAVLALYVIGRTLLPIERHQAVATALVISLPLIATAVTHHVTAFLLVAFLVLAAVVAPSAPRQRR